ncbi:MAG TPA: polysaccharide deacetylase family protein [Myxococcota bacterium]|nr:polysaccharide deacetylase family protein [Myxococcota bacterium]
MVVISLIACVAQSAEPWRVAVTIDDLPWNGVRPEQGVAPGTSKLLKTLTEHGVPAVGFVNCEPAWPEALEQWRAAGFELGNHQARHDDLRSVDPDLWLEGVHSCTAELGEGTRYFRYPYLRRGNTVEIRDRVRADIEQTLTIAPVTIDNHEWMLAQKYQEGNAKAAGLYADHLLRAGRHFRELGVEVTGRDVPHVLLLHVNSLAADHLDEVLSAYEEEGAVWVDLETALSDPLYAMEDHYAGKGGISWLYRVTPGEPTLEWDTAEWKRLESELTIIVE